EGEELMVHRFATGTLGLTPACPGWKDILLAASKPAVCVPPGARLLLHDIPYDLQQSLSVGVVEEVTFVQQSAEVFHYRDAVRFANGREILLQYLRCGQRIDVLSLSSHEDAEGKKEHQIRPKVYQDAFVVCSSVSVGQ